MGAFNTSAREHAGLKKHNVHATTFHGNATYTQRPATDGARRKAVALRQPWHLRPSAVRSKMQIEKRVGSADAPAPRDEPHSRALLCWM